MQNGRANEEGYYEDLAAGAKAAADSIGAGFRIVDNVAFDPQAAIDGITSLAEAGSDLIIIDGSSSEAASVVAEQFPDVEFAVYVSPVTADLPNLHGYAVVQAESQYVLGVIGAMLSQSGKQTFIGGFEDVPSSQGGGGFKLGGEATATEVNIVFPGSYSDPVLTKQAASAGIANGSDSLNVFNDGAGYAGAIAAVDESGQDVYMFSTTVDRCSLHPLVAANALLLIGETTQQMVDDFVAGTMPQGTRFLSFPEGASAITVCPPYDTPEILAAVEQTIDDFANGLIPVPTELTGIPE